MTPDFGPCDPLRPHDPRPRRRVVTPGPGAYDSPIVKFKKLGAATFGESLRFGGKAKSTTGATFRYAAVGTQVSSRNSTAPRATFARANRISRDRRTPGPGDYFSSSTARVVDTPSYSFSGGADERFVGTTHVSPGPSYYDVSPSHRVAAPLMGTSARFMTPNSFCRLHRARPGPGAYRSVSSFGKQVASVNRTSISCAFGSDARYKVASTTSPGPGDYGARTYFGRQPHSRAAVVGGSGDVVGFTQLALNDEVCTSSTLAPETVVARLVECADLALATAYVEWTEVHGVGVGTPGAVEDGVVIAAANLFAGHSRVPLRKLLAEAIAAKRGGDSVSICLVNDADAALLAELWIGAARSRGNVAMLTLGSGIGCAAALEGRVLRGALEGGHMIVNSAENARSCTCGSRGCLEAYASANSIVRMYEEAGGPSRTQVVDVAMRHVALGAINLIRILDPALVVLAGGVVAGGTVFLSRLRDTMDSLDWTCLPRRSDRVVLAAAGLVTGCVGAAKAALDHTTPPVR
ncbi:hypothetical protein CTAYLR_006587 [Chrysophaeum taylorii]|uniref:ROK family protein n=1 Tax=Chrysophaeum taylorii TaxID=2483200 RepID=A0AAD7XMQ0_9STRA|nr:hypothetical protein CTAYLR_006587 [Chrysophaeum taylorii]